MHVRKGQFGYNATFGLTFLFLTGRKQHFLCRRLPRKTASTKWQSILLVFKCAYRWSPSPRPSVLMKICNHSIWAQSI